MNRKSSSSAIQTADSPYGQTAIEIFSKEYNKAELDNERAQILNKHPEFAEYIAEGIRRFSKRLLNYDLAKSILGKDFITPSEIGRVHPSIVYSLSAHTELFTTLPSEEILRWCKENGYAVIPSPLHNYSLLELRDLPTFHFCKEMWKGGKREKLPWYRNDGFARNDKTSFGWLIIKKTPLLQSTNKTWSEQLQGHSSEHVDVSVPNVAEMSWFITTYFRVRGIRLFQDVSVRTSSVSARNSRVCVGYFDKDGLNILFSWGYDRDSKTGLSAERLY